MLILRALAFALGLFIVFVALRSAIKTFVLPRAAPDGITRLVFRSLRRVFNVVCLQVPSYLQRDRIMSFYAPVGLIVLVPVLLIIVDAGFTLMFWAVREQPLVDAFSLSGSSLLTLGFVAPVELPERMLAFVEAALGMTITALLIAYLPTIYSVFSQREALVSALETRAGTPPWGVTLIERHYWLDRMDDLGGVWQEWERWFTQIEETHTSLASVVFFRSQRPNRSWITAAGAVLDAAALTRAAVDIPPDPQADLMIRAGYLALRYIAQPYGFALNPDPRFPDDAISVTRAEFDEAYEHLRVSGVPMRVDREQAWLDFAGWRVNYDAPLLGLCALVMAPVAPWSSDRADGLWHLTPRFKTPNIALDADTQYRERKEAELPNIEGVLPEPAVAAVPLPLNPRLRQLDRRLLRRPRGARGRGSRSTVRDQPRRARHRRPSG
jgi:hypothetical protein